MSEKAKRTLAWLQSKCHFRTSLQQELWEACAYRESGFVLAEPARERVALLLGALCAGELEESTTAPAALDGDFLLLLKPGSRVEEWCHFLRGFLDDTALAPDLELRVLDSDAIEAAAESATPTLWLSTLDEAGAVALFAARRPFYERIRVLILEDWAQGSVNALRWGELASARLRGARHDLLVWALAAHCANPEEAACRALGFSRQFWIIRGQEPGAPSSPPPEHRGESPLRQDPQLQAFLRSYEEEEEEQAYLDLKDTVSFELIEDKDFWDIWEASRRLDE